MRFEPGSVKVDRIKEDAEYAGIRAAFTGTLGSARIPMQIDVGFGDVMYPGAEERAFPTILDAPAPRLRTYPRETVVAEKFQAMVYLGSLNSRMKDFSTSGSCPGSSTSRAHGSPPRSPERSSAGRRRCSPTHSA